MLDTMPSRPLNEHPMINLDNALNRAIVFGNGESRKWVDTTFWNQHDIQTWGCNAIYRDMWVDNLVAVDYAMQQEIYTTDMLSNQTSVEDESMIFHFANWAPIPAEISDMMFLGYDIPEEFVHKTKRAGHHTEQCVVSGKDPDTVSEKIKEAMKMNPDMSKDDLKLKMSKDVGIWITYLQDRDNVKPIDFPVGWSAGNTALHLACQQGVKEVYMVGYDLSSYDEPLNNIYKGTDNYLPKNAKGFNSINWMNQMHTVFTEFKDVTFYWVDAVHREGEVNNVKNINIRYLTKAEFCGKLGLIN
jgi:hypothetical protein